MILTIMLPLHGFSQTKKKFAVGFKGGTYESIARSLNDAGILDVEIINSQGSDEIIELVNKGSAGYGIAQIDILLSAYNKKEWSVKNVLFALPLHAAEVLIPLVKD